MRVGILGLGIIGSAWAKNLLEDGLLSACWNRTPKEGFPGFRATPGEVASAADVLIVCVADPAAVAAVLESLPLEPRHLVIQTSTIDPASADTFCRTVRAAGARYVEAPFTGSKPMAEQRKTVFFLGGDARDLADAETALAPISQKRVVLGTPAQAATFKLSLNLIAANYAQALCEALHRSRKAGIPDDTFFDAVRPSVVWNGFAALKEPKLKAGDFTTQFSVKHMLKDMRLASKAGADDLPLTAAVAERLQRAADAGYGDDDFISLIRLLGPRPGA